MVGVAVIGGGYTGTAFAVHLARATRIPLDITVVEPRKRVGGGLAHSAIEPDHRLNAPDVIHPLYPDDDLHFRRWLETAGRLAEDPEAWYADGRLYPRRGDFGAYLTAQFESHAAENPSGSRLTHRQSSARAIEQRESGFRVELADGESLQVARCIIAIGREPTPLDIPGLDASTAAGRTIQRPLNPGALDPIQRDEKVLTLGSGLTAADAIAALLRRGHRGPITSLSRRGLRPKDQNPEPATEPLWERIAVQPPAFVQDHGLPPTILSLMRIVRADARRRMERGEPWHGAIDAVRDAAGEIWCALPTDEKRRFMRHLKPYYDSHRFRIPPQTRDILAESEKRGQLTFLAGRLIGAEPMPDGVKVSIRRRGAPEPRAEAFAAIMVCAGFSSSVESSSNPFLQSCLRQGLARPSDMGRGLDSDDACRVIAADGLPVPRLYVLGAMTIDRFGETPAAIFILRQIHRMLPAFVSALR